MRVLFLGQMSIGFLTAAWPKNAWPASFKLVGGTPKFAYILLYLLFRSLAWRLPLARLFGRMTFGLSFGFLGFSIT